MFRHLLYFFIFLLPISPKFSRWVVLAAFLAWLFEPNKNWRGLLQPAALLPFAWFLWHAINSLVLHNAGQSSVNDVTLQLSFLAFPLLVGTVDINNTHTIKALKAFQAGLIIAMTYCLIIAIKNYFGGSADVFFYENLVAPLDFHPTYFGWCVGFSLLMILYNFIATKDDEYLKDIGSFLRPIMLIYAIFFGGFLLLLSSRIALLGVFIIVVGWFLYKQYKNGKILVALGITTGSSALLLFFISQINFLKWRFAAIFPFLLNENEKTRLHTDPRSLIFKNALQAIQESPIFGIGKHASTQLVENTTKLSGTILNNTHNQFLETQLVLGIVGTAILVGMLIVLLKKAISLQQYGTFSFIIIVFVSLFVCCSMTEALLERERGILFFVYFYALFSNMQYVPENAVATDLDTDK
jgi:O-antigen ligase